MYRGTGLCMKQIYQYIKDEIRKGNIRPEKQLPSSRDLAKSLKVSRSTTQLAYEQLVSEGYLEAVPRKGYFAASLDGIFPPVARSAAARTDQKKELSSGMEQEKCRGAALFGKNGSRFFPARDRPGGLSLCDMEKDQPCCPEGGGPGALSERRSSGRPDPQGGDPGISPCGARRELRCIPDHHRAGNEYLLMLLSQLLGKDAVIAMEDPTYRQAYRVLSGVGHKVLPVGIDKNGFCVKELEDQTAQAAYVMPSHQFPTGIVMP